LDWAYPRPGLSALAPWHMRMDKYHACQAPWDLLGIVRGGCRLSERAFASGWGRVRVIQRGREGQRAEGRCCWRRVGQRQRRWRAV
jgi:hypothetical protein